MPIAFGKFWKGRRKAQKPEIREGFPAESHSSRKGWLCVSKCSLHIFSNLLVSYTCSYILYLHTCKRMYTHHLFPSVYTTYLYTWMQVTQSTGWSPFSLGSKYGLGEERPFQRVSLVAVLFHGIGQQPVEATGPQSSPSPQVYSVRCLYKC